MKPHPRIRKTIKWGGAAAATLVAGVCVGSWWCTLILRPWNEYIAACEQGRVYFDHTRNGSEAEPIVECRRSNKRSFGPRWSTGFETRPRDRDFWQITVPLWPFALPFAAAFACAWRVDILARRRARLNICPKCNYDRAGIAGDAKCPECGCVGASAGGPS
jgi:hypothetical protein